MEVYQTENLQVEAIKQFFKKYSRLFVFGLILFVVVVAAGRYWQHHERVQEAKASDLFQEMLIAEVKKDKQVIDIKAQELIKNYASTPYGQFAALRLAKEAVDVADFKTAEAHLRWVIAQSNSKKLSFYIANERLARIMLQTGDFDAGLKLLNSNKPEKGYVTLYEEAKGDLYMAKGDKDAAKTAYLKAMQDLPAGAQAPILQLKLLDFGVGVDNA